MSEPRRNPVDELAEEFVERYRRGERPALTEYTRQHPDLAAEIRELFPALVMIEEAGPAEAEPILAGNGTITVDGGILQQLGDYRIVRQIGRGGMGVVFEAVQEALGRHVALKVLPLAFAKDPINLKRFRREARSAARLHHTNIVPVFDIGECQGIHYYAMQFIQGQGLDEVLQELRRMRRLQSASHDDAAVLSSTAPYQLSAAEHDLSFRLATGLWTGQFRSNDLPGETRQAECGERERGASTIPPAAFPNPPPTGVGLPVKRGGREEDTPLPAFEDSTSSVLGHSSEFSSPSDYHIYRSVARVGLQVAEALAYAHGQKVLHRDIKPSNLLLDSQGTVWVTDFGLAKEEECEDLTRTGDIVGTLRYMAPERFSGLADPRSDIYSLGMTLYELLTLQPVFEERDRARLIHRIAAENPARPRRVDPGVPRDLETIVCKAIAKEPRDRYATAEEMGEDLQRFLADRPIRSRRASILEHSLRWCRRNRALTAMVGLAAVATIATLATLALAVLFVTRSRDDARQLAREKEELADTERSLRKQAELDAAEWSFGEAYSKCLQEDAGRGMLWLSRSLGVAHRAEAVDLEEAIRYQLAAWSRYVHPLAAMFGHNGLITVVAYSPDGKCVVTGSVDGTARLWEVATGMPLVPPLQHRSAIRGVAFSPDSKIVLTGSDDHTARLWEVATGKALGPPLQHEGSVDVVAFSTDGKKVLTGGFDNTARLWDVPTGKPVGEPMRHQGMVVTAAFSPDGKTVLTGSLDKIARLWNVETGQAVGLPLPHQSAVSSVAFSPDGKAVLTTGGGNTAQLWEVATWKPLGSPLHHQNVVDIVAFSPDGKTVATGSHDETARLWEVPTGKSLGSPLQHHGYVRALAFSPDGRTVLTGSWDYTARLWDVPTGNPVGPPLNHRSAVVSAAFGPDGKTVLTGSYDSTARLWRVETGKAVGPPLRLQPQLRALNFSPDAKCVLTCGHDRTARLWDLATTKPVSPPLAHPEVVNIGVVSPDGKTVLTVSDDTIQPRRSNQTAQLWDLSTGKPVGAPFQHNDEINAAAFSPDGKAVVTASADRTAQVWEVGFAKALTGKPTQVPGGSGPALQHPQQVNAAAFSPDGKTVLTGCWDCMARLWVVGTGERMASFQHQGPVVAVALSPDGDTVLTGSHDRTAQLWEIATGNRRGPPLQHQGVVEAVAFSPDGKFVLTGSSDHTARVWEVARGKAVGPPLQHQGAVDVVAFSPDGKTVLTASDDRTLRRWEIPPPVPGAVKRIKLWTEVLTAMELEENGTVRVLNAPEWQNRRRLLQELGGPPQDPISKP